jgi:hypothetical protein
MPKDDDPLTADEAETIKRWIDAGAADFNPEAAPREPVMPAQMMSLMRDDLTRLDERDRPFARYFTLTLFTMQAFPTTNCRRIASRCRSS